MSEIYINKKNDNNYNIRLKLFIILNYKTFRTFAEVIQTDSSNVSNFVNGKRKPNFNNLHAIFLSGCSVDWLLSGEGSMWNVAPTGFKLAKENRQLLIDYRVDPNDDEDIIYFLKNYENGSHTNYSIDDIPIQSVDNNNVDSDLNDVDIDEFFNNLAEDIKRIPNIINSKLKND